MEYGYLGQGPAAGSDEEFEDAVGGPGIAQIRLDDWVELLEGALAESARAHHALARLHVVDVASQRVDLAVVGQHSQRMRPLPARERVRREARVNQCQISLVLGFLSVKIPA